MLSVFPAILKGSNHLANKWKCCGPFDCTEDNRLLTLTLLAIPLSDALCHFLSHIYTMSMEPFITVITATVDTRLSKLLQKKKNTLCKLHIDLTSWNSWCLVFDRCSTEVVSPLLYCFCPLLSLGPYLTPHYPLGNITHLWITSELIHYNIRKNRIITFFFNWDVLNKANPSAF